MKKLKKLLKAVMANSPKQAERKRIVDRARDSPVRAMQLIRDSMSRLNFP
jgi:hypothetical protein